MADAPVICVGGSIATLVAADALRRAGREVDLLLPSRGVGGSFAAPERDGIRLDLGVRLLELGYDDDPTVAMPPLAAYAPRYGGHRPYAALVASYLTELLDGDLAEVPTPELHLDGRWHRDVLFTVDLRRLRELLPAASVPAIAAEVARARRTVGDAGVMALPPVAREGMTLEQASRANHGDTFHDLLIGPLCDKICARGAEAALAEYARKLWMPLFWPRTLAEAVAGEAPAFCPDRRFHTLTGGLAGIVDRLLARTGGRTVGALVGADADALVFADGTRVASDRAVIGCGAEEAFAAAGCTAPLERLTSACAWLEADDRDLLHAPSMAHVADADEAVFRVSRNGHQPRAGTTTLVVELRHDVAPDVLAGAAAGSLERLGVLREGAGTRTVATWSGASFAAPDAANRTRFAACADALHERVPGAVVVGPAASFGADSLNEQVVQGLHAAAVLA
jgi:hypothetical protein